jgi:two-component system nitrogen regulation sensor histidine kinase GlnL
MPPTLDVSLFDLLATAVLVLDREGRIVHANAAAEHLLELSRSRLIGSELARLFSDAEELSTSIAEAVGEQFADKRQNVRRLRPGQTDLQLSATVVSLVGQPWPALVELREIEQQLKVERDARFGDQARANRELVRSLAHEIKNPLGGLRGAAQLLEAELPDPELREYTQVIIQEADRLQNLVDRLLEPHRAPRLPERLNIHEVCERVRSLVLAEYPKGLSIERDYDTSAPELLGDKAQLIQVLLNIVHNAAQVLRPAIARSEARILLRTRVVRQVTLHGKRHKLALDLHVVDNGPGIPEELRDRIFYPLVSGRDGGTGLGLTLAQTFVEQHEGLIECESRPGMTDFRILLPIG